MDIDNIYEMQDDDGSWEEQAKEEQEEDYRFSHRYEMELDYEEEYVNWMDQAADEAGVPWQGEI